MPAMRALAAFDKFRGTVTAAEACAAAARGATRAGWTCTEVPVADGGEGILDVLGGANRTTLVTGPLGDTVEAGWRLVRDVAVIEMARASGLVLVGGAEGNDALAASTYGTGELIQAALDAGARRIIVGVGGSATTDGGLGALRALSSTARLRGVTVTVACDVRTPFLDAADLFGPQKGASPTEVKLLRSRLAALAETYAAEYGVDVRGLEGAGAAGGLAGGLAAIGAELLSGFEVVAEEVCLPEQVEAADLVITGEGLVDEESFDGKVVGGMVELAAEHGVPVLVVAGQVLPEVDGRVDAVSLRDAVGEERAWSEAAQAIEDVVAERLAAFERSRRPDGLTDHRPG
jgi:glycerate kinase